ncbi:MAG: TetR/AcrR family transcriptional regulator [Pseudanabaenales cyanobacterium]|nr:TetR/AcrR family transcriptional regulator [Pseudanabaenales cyanobacterium]
MPRKTRVTPRKLPKQDRSKMTVDAILTAAAHILTEDGYDTASTNRIAERAGVSIGSLYQYFPNKEAIMTAVKERHVDEMAEIVESTVNQTAQQPLKVALHELIKACVAAHLIAPTLHQVLNEQVPRLNQSSAEAKITLLLREFLVQRHDQIQVQNLELSVFILERTIESLVHAAVIDHPEFLQESQLEEEMTRVLLSFLSRQA